MEDKSPTLFQQLGIDKDHKIKYIEDEIVYKYYECKMGEMKIWSYTKYMDVESNLNIIDREKHLYY
jgi:hypothetical protein